MAEKRFRLKFMFWLDVKKTDENDVAVQIEELKATRKFTQTIRDGIRLICDLRQGRVEVLFELFPWVKAEFIAGVHTHETPAEHALREQLERIERQLLQQGNIPVSNPFSLSSSVSGQPKALTVSQFAVSVDDDETVPIVVKQKKNDDSGHTLLNAVLRLNS